MPRYIVQRTFTDGLNIPIDAEGAEISRSVVKRNAEVGVTWVHSYVSRDKSVTYCLYDGPDPEAISWRRRPTGCPSTR